MKVNPQGLSRRYVAALQKLKQEILRRRAAEQALKKSGRHSTELLEKSRQMQESLRNLSRQVLLVQEEERKEISRELHNKIAQTLAGINVHLATLRKTASINIQGLRKKINDTQRLVEKSLNLVHRFAHELHPSLLDDLGLVPALQSHIKEFTKRTRIPVCFTSFSGVDQLSGDKRTALYRVAQSALMNVSQHAHASRVDVRIQKLPRGILRMSIKDNGKSFRVDRVFFAKKCKRLGLLGMRERVEMVGGVFAVDSVQGEGTTVSVEIPCADNIRG